MALVEGREHVVLSHIEQLFDEKNKEIADLKDEIADLKDEIADLQFKHETEINDLKLVHQTTFDKFQKETKEAMDKVQKDNNKIFLELQDKVKILQDNKGVYSFVKDNCFKYSWQLVPVVFIAPMIILWINESYSLK